MMTIRHVHDQGEYLVETTNVQWHSGHLHYTAPGGQICELDKARGTAYVMNDHGATVATYRTDNPPVERQD